MGFPWRQSAGAERSARWLRRRIVTALLVVSAVPFVLLGGGAWIVFRDLAIERTLTLHRAMLRAHASAIDLYLAEQVRTLETIARTHRLETLATQDGLARVFAVLTAVHPDRFVDLGVIDAAGRHLAYVGPYDLLDRRYGDTEWFRTVAARGTIVSDVFLGYRRVPHSVVAVRRQDGSRWWILRATLDSRRLDDLVRALQVGREGDVFVVNRGGRYQTAPREGAVLDRSPLAAADLDADAPERRVRTAHGTLRRVATALNGGQWLLVVQQPEREILAPVTRAVAVGAVLTGAALALVVLTIVVVTSRLTRRVERADRERDRMYADLLRSAKLASLGELATGLAHEINNPLATIAAEQTNLADLSDQVALPESVRQAFDRSIARCRHQVARCAAITAKMLQFGRPTDTALRPTAVEPVLREIAALLDRRTRASGVTLALAVAPDLPPARLDANELEQVLVNLVNNAIDATAVGGTIAVAAAREGDHLLLTVQDDGCGIAPEHLDRVFQPFFTTKPPGKGTGLGLSVVYGIVRGWGGTLQADSTPGQGTTMAVRIPLADAADPRDAGDVRPGATGSVAARQGESHDHDSDPAQPPAAARR
jgi:two-component system NtrC family sensor kinase